MEKGVKLSLVPSRVMTNDILEQIAEDYFRQKGYFTRHNIKYRPSKGGNKFSVHSDIDVMGLHPFAKGVGKVIVASCKSWQGGLNIKSKLKLLKNDPERIVSGRENWKTFHELAHPTWAKALKKQVKEDTGQDNFTFYLVVTRYKGNAADWENFEIFKKNLMGCAIKLIDMKTMVLDLMEEIDTTPAHSELSRLLQLIKAGKGSIDYFVE